MVDPEASTGPSFADAVKGSVSVEKNINDMTLMFTEERGEIAHFLYLSTVTSSNLGIEVVSKRDSWSSNDRKKMHSTVGT